MEHLPEDVVKRLREVANRLEGAGARAIVNYVIYELEVGGPSKEVIHGAEQMARQEIEELKELLRILDELKNLVA
ncbi:MAG: hypothetical protein ACP5H5_03010 [Pyrobaculum sp.]|jgi:hypothetical protein